MMGLNFSKRSGLLIATALVTLLTACGQDPLPLPPPPPPMYGGGGYGGGGGSCVSVSGAVNLNPSGQAYQGILMGQSGGATSSISASFWYQNQPNAGFAIQNIVANGTISLPGLTPANPFQQGQSSSSYCVSSADPDNGQIRNGRLSSMGAVQIILSSKIPISFSPYAGYPGGYFSPGANVGTPGFGTGQDRLDVQVGYSCNAGITAEGRLYGCVDVSVQYLGVRMNLYAQ